MIFTSLLVYSHHWVFRPNHWDALYKADVFKSFSIERLNARDKVIRMPLLSAAASSNEINTGESPVLSAVH